LSPRPTSSELVHDYATDPFWSAEQIASRPRRRNFDARRFARLELVTRGPGSLLVIACLDGAYLLENARNRGWRTLGVEFVQHPLDHAQQSLHLDMVRSTFWDLAAVRGRQFDAIYTHGLEHVPDLAGAIGSFRELLRPHGVVMIEAPNQFEALKERMKEALWPVFGERLVPFLKSEAPPHAHLSFFTPQTIRRLLEENGFEVLRQRTYLRWNPIYHVTARGRTFRELIYLVGGWVGRGPSTEIIARPAPRPGREVPQVRAEKPFISGAPNR
jgi:2-polyprenyl-3-methyl-5-hydroxy-6-metoxy-1,4-benzoquinol methylase